MNTYKITLELCSCPDHVVVPEFIEGGATLPQECMEAIRSAQETIRSNVNIISVCLRYEPELNQAILDRVEEDININISYLIVYEEEIYWYVQDKWDCFNQVEYIIDIKE